ncbi:MAG: phosphatidylglycerol lysyltransferase domain-containing protein [Verrucomicrobiota bacterium]
MSQEERIEQFAYAYGTTYDSYLINDGNREIFQSEGADGLLGFIRDGKYIHVIGGLLAATPEAKTLLLQEFFEVTRQQKIKTVLFHNILEEDLPLFRSFGVEATKCGEEAVIPLQQTDWLGNQYEWVRRQESYCRRKALVAQEVTNSLNDSTRQELEWISADHVKRTTTGKEFSYFAGRLFLDDLKRQRIFVAKSVDRVEAFIVCNPGKQGRFYAIEMYRYRQDAPRGAMPFLWMQTLRLLKEEGIEEASLCMMPFYGCDQKHPQDNAFLRFCNIFWFRHLNWLFNAKGLHLFKSRFRPQGKSMFTVCYPKTSIGGLWSAFQLWELSAIVSPAGLARRFIRKVSGFG